MVKVNSKTLTMQKTPVADGNWIARTQNLTIGDERDWQCVYETKVPAGYLKASPVMFAAFQDRIYVLGRNLQFESEEERQPNGLRLPIFNHRKWEQGMLPDLPMTGATGQVIAVIAAVLLLGGAAALVAARRKKNQSGQD